ncbi:hypothetical protein K503DRAFT_870375 [Rhizopogon vinicolor AM-OR11-026]|uniref:Uncharacterized protein n=1 Tax=Rhizopogon vinicolor AM-OR11-026 TaxID=1314800 RepID=A0A1B7MHE7_9AGAM|nr:hypothetical protein K503DRAFT_870375 [Rhizopogon vinicolor AM-OR11-026]
MPPLVLTDYFVMLFATLVVLAVVVSSTHGLAAPAPYIRNRSNSKRDTATTAPLSIPLLRILKH